MADATTDKGQKTTAPPSKAEGEVVVVEKKAKPKYSRNLRGVQELERGVSKALNRVAKSADDGLAAWRKARDKSAEKRKDGAIIDALPNAAAALGKSLRVMSRAPRDIARALPRPKKLRKALSRLLPLL